MRVRHRHHAVPSCCNREGTGPEYQGYEVVASGEISVVFADVEDAAARVRAVSANIDMQLNDLRGMLRPLAAEWTGAAAVNYQYQQHVWDKASEDLHGVLLRIAAVLENSHGTYVDADSQLRKLWGK